MVSWEVGTIKKARHALGDSVEVMVREYLANLDPVEYWAHKAATCPNLSCVAIKLLLAPTPTSVQSEVFSLLGVMVQTRF